ncbi:MAG: glycerol-3-phosphate dehydrogenase [Acidobacteriota bacterium]|nr:glycerol-3-phosphate dehydrogenase [Acidobacteriota bacterium]
MIGAGINGAGIARDATIRGLKVLLLDRGDIGGGTSSWSTRLIHGGLRYLEYSEFGLVRESLRERECLMNIAPHLIRPFPILVPIYENSRRGPWTIRAGMFAYDLLSFGKTLPRHRILSRVETLKEAPTLEPNRLLGAAIYYDAQVEFAERLVLENAISAAEHGAEVITYARVNEFIVEEGLVGRVDFTSELNGASQSVQSKIVINAAGPWVDDLLEKTGTASPRLIGGTKGSHVIVAPFSGAPATAIYVEAQADCRPFFIIPWNDNYLIGTTDIRYRGDLDQVQIGADEADYLLSETNRVIPKANLDRSKILYTYSGVRPLPYTNDKDEQSITRRHFIRQHPQLANLLSIVGGKLTTYRSLAKETVDMVFRKLGQTIPKCVTDQQPLPGANTSDLDAFGKDFKQQSGLPEAISNRLLRIYGVRAAEVLKLTAADPLPVEVFDDETQAIAAEVIYAFRNEMAQTLTDCLLRRTMVGLNSTCGLHAVEPAAKIAQKQLGWSESRTQQEIRAYQNHVERFRVPHNL